MSFFRDWRIWLAFAAAAVVLLLAGGLSGAWQAGDHAVFRALFLPQPPQPDPRIGLIDVEYPPEMKRAEQPARLRQTLAQVLGALAAQPNPPQTVLIDLWLSSNPAGIAELAGGIKALRARGTRVLAAVDPTNRHGALADDPLAAHNQAIYLEALDGYGHTALDYAFGVLKYPRELSFPVKSGGSMVGQNQLTALPVLATVTAERIATLPDSLVIPVGDDARFAARTIRVGLAEGSAATPAPMPGVSYLIIGAFAEDSDNLLGRPGPLLLAWAMSDLLAGRAGAAREPLNHPGALLGLAAIGALIALAGFDLMFRMVRARIAPPRWRRATWALAGGAFAVAAASLAAVAAIVLLTGRVIPVAYPLACAALASGVAAFRARLWIADQQVRTMLGGRYEERAVEYDVFISYAHDPPENLDWVKTHIAGPLGEMRHTDGRPYKIFFDEHSIKVGREWKREIELALLGTRCFVPVYSDGYFQRGYCREEMELADQLRIDGRLRIFPVARTVDGIPERYLRKVQYIDAATDPDFGAALIEQIGSA